MPVRSKTEDLENFIAVVDAGGFSAAAELRGVQVARVSRSITRLEASLGVSVINRTTRRVELTQEGSIFLAHVREGMNAIERGEECLRSMHTAPSGLLRVDAASPFVFHQIAPHVGAFSQQYPDIRLDITSHEGIIDLLEHKTDIAIRIGDLKDSNLHYKLLGRSRLMLVCSPSYLDTNPSITRVSDLMQHQLIGFSGRSKLNRWPLSEVCDLTFAVQASSGETIRQLCLCGQGIALMSRFMCYQDIRRGDLVEILRGSVVTPNTREAVHAVYYKNSAVSSRILAFMDFLKPRLEL